jgi:hypothetical protein
MSFWAGMRGIEPYDGSWYVPCGFVDYGETFDAHDGIASPCASAHGGGYSRHE